MITKENSYVLQNGNYSPSSEKETMDVNTWKGTITAYVNRTNSPVCLKKGYSTTANGSCDDLVVPPNHGIFKSANGDGYSFAVYRVFAIANA